MNSDLEKISSLVRKSRKFLITSHRNPDADAIGSMLSLGLGLEQMGKDVLFYNKDGVPEALRFLPCSERVVSSLERIEGDFDVAIAVDSAGLNRVGREFVDFTSRGRCRYAVIIDHHQTSHSSVDVCLLDKGAPSTGVIIYDILQYLSIKIDGRVATNLYATILGDTGSFRYSNATHKAFVVAAELVRSGAKPDEISQALYENEPLRKFKLLGFALPTLDVLDDYAVAYIIVDKAMFRNARAGREDTEGMVNFPRSITGVEVAVLFRQEGDDGNGRVDWKISLRSKGNVDVSSIAEGFGGGGHKNAAGCSIIGDIKTVKGKVFDSIRHALDYNRDKVF